MNHRGTKTQRDLLPKKTNEISRDIVDAAFRVHSRLGPGLLESVYEACLVHELVSRGFSIRRQAPVPILYDAVRLEAGLRLDLVVEKCVVVELKAVERLLEIHSAQVLTYLKLSGHRLGLLINFNVAVLKDGIRRLIL